MHLRKRVSADFRQQVGFWRSVSELDSRRLDAEGKANDIRWKIKKNTMDHKVQPSQDFDDLEAAVKVEREIEAEKDRYPSADDIQKDFPSHLHTFRDHFVLSRVNTAQALYAEAEHCVQFTPPGTSKAPCRALADKAEKYQWYFFTSTGIKPYPLLEAHLLPEDFEDK